MINPERIYWRLIQFMTAFVALIPCALFIYFAVENLGFTHSMFPGFDEAGTRLSWFISGSVGGFVAHYLSRWMLPKRPPRKITGKLEPCSWYSVNKKNENGRFWIHTDEDGDIVALTSVDQKMPFDSAEKRSVIA